MNSAPVAAAKSSNIAMGNYDQKYDHHYIFGCMEYTGNFKTTVRLYKKS